MWRAVAADLLPPSGHGLQVSLPNAPDEPSEPPSDREAGAGAGPGGGRAAERETAAEVAAAGPCLIRQEPVVGVNINV